MKKILYFFAFACLFISCANNNQEKSDPLQKKSVNSETSSFKNSSAVIKQEDIESEKFETENLIVKLTPFIPNYSSFSQTEIGLLKSRLNSAIAQYGYGGEASNPRFIVGPVVNILFQEITSTAPSLYACTYEINFLMADVISQTIFSSYTVEFKGVGETPSKAFVSGFRKVDLKTQGFYDFLKDGEDKIVEYYNHNCDRFIMEAKALYNERNYDEAYVILKNIPYEANNCFADSRGLRDEIFKKKLSNSCNELLMKMKAEFGKFNDPSASGFNDEAMAYYMLIDAESSCYPEAQTIYSNYISKLDHKGRKEWNDNKLELERQIKEAESKRQFKSDSLKMVYNYLNKKQELESRAEIEGNKKLLEKYKKDQAYEKQPWIRKLFHLGENDPFDGYDEDGV